MTATPTPVPTIDIEVDSEFARESAQTVLLYLDALQHGDETSAYALLGGEPGSPGLVLLEEAFMNAGARIVSIHATGTSTTASAQADVVSGQSEYDATYTLERGPTGPIIRSHTFTQVH
jgi:hypothetical protein